MPNDVYKSLHILGKKNSVKFAFSSYIQIREPGLETGTEIGQTAGSGSVTKSPGSETLNKNIQAAGCTHSQGAHKLV